MGKKPYWERPDKMTDRQRLLCERIGAYALHLLNGEPASDANAWHDADAMARYSEGLTGEQADRFDDVCSTVLSPRIADDQQPAETWGKLGVNLAHVRRVYLGKMELQDALARITPPVHPIFMTALQLMRNGDRGLIHESIHAGGIRSEFQGERAVQLVIDAIFKGKFAPSDESSPSASKDPLPAAEPQPAREKPTLRAVPPPQDPENPEPE